MKKILVALLLIVSISIAFAFTQKEEIIIYGVYNSVCSHGEFELDGTSFVTVGPEQIIINVYDPKNRRGIEQILSVVDVVYPDNFVTHYLATFDDGGKSIIAVSVEGIILWRLPNGHDVYMYIRSEDGKKFVPTYRGAKEIPIRRSK